MNAQATSLQDFQAELKKLGKDVVREEVPDKERVRRAKQAFMRKLDGRRAVDLDTCLHCGMCAEACPFYEATQNEKYAPVYKYRLLRRFYRREMSPVRWFYKPFTRDISIDDLREWKHYVFDACTGCARCDMICPMGINVSTLIRVVREGLGAAGMMPDELADLRQEQDEKNHGRNRPENGGVHRGSPRDWRTRLSGITAPHPTGPEPPLQFHEDWSTRSAWREARGLGRPGTADRSSPPECRR